MKDMVCKNCMSDGEWEYIEEWVDEGERFVLVMCIGCGYVYRMWKRRDLGGGLNEEVENGIEER